MRKKRTKIGLLLALVYLLTLEGYTLFNDEPNDTISEVMSEWGYDYPILVVGTWLLLAGHWWWRLGGPQKKEEYHVPERSDGRGEGENSTDKVNTPGPRKNPW